jgi:hypothetical protein
MGNVRCVVGDCPASAVEVAVEAVGSLSVVVRALGKSFRRP